MRVNGHAVNGQTTTPTNGAAHVGAQIALKLTKEHRPRPVLCNILAIFGNDARWTGVLGYNELTDCITLVQRPPYQQEALTT